MKRLPISKARARLGSVVNNIASRKRRVVLTKNGRPAAVLMSAADYDGIAETMEILSDKPLMRQIRKSASEFNTGKGRVMTLDELFGPEK